jgi:hypothetical protein
MLHLSEQHRLEKLAHHPLQKQGSLVRVKTLATVEARDRAFPLLSFSIGTENPSAPVLGLFGGVHGLERVGTHVVLAYLESFLEQMQWDEHLQELLKKMRLVAMPMVNPAGIMFGTRSNPKGVDLMRNAPVEADQSPPWLVGGHRISPRLPWYRGLQDAPMETEAQALVDFVRAEMFSSSAALAIDFHSGFGLRDRLWYPYAKTKTPFPRIAQALAIKGLFDRSFPHHVYQIEPQCVNYTTHGDLWDYLFDEHYGRRSPDRQSIFIPWTLEMGSWQWVKKNPSQIFLALGPYNPIKPHRYKRVMRRHITMIDFFMRCALNWNAWGITE